MGVNKALVVLRLLTAASQKLLRAGYKFDYVEEYRDLNRIVNLARTVPGVENKNKGL